MSAAADRPACARVRSVLGVGKSSMEGGSGMPDSRQWSMNLQGLKRVHGETGARLC